MTQSTHDVVAVGNAIVDVIARAEEVDLEALGLAKGQMTLIEAEQIAPIYARMGSAVEISGGSAANTVAGVASFGGRSGFIGKVADDEFGHIFQHDMSAVGVDCRIARNGAKSPPTARSLIMVTPDGERTMSTYLGISPLLAPEDLDADFIAGAQVVYLEGYLYDREDAKNAFAQAAAIARGAGRKVALTLSDAFCVDRHRDAFKAFARDQADILFANESEITSLFEVNTFDEAMAAIGSLSCLVALTRSEKGSVVVSGEEIHIVDAKKCDEVVDTTGAGDLYAAGFLYGLTHGASLPECAKLGALAAAEIISHVGARPEVPLKSLI